MAELNKAFACCKNENIKSLFDFFQPQKNNEAVDKMVCYVQLL